METPPTDLDAQQEAREEAERAKAARREQEIADFEWLMQEPRFRRFVWRQMSEAGVFHESPNLGHAEMAREKGLRSTGLRLLAEILEVCPQYWLSMVTEQKVR